MMTRPVLRYPGGKFKLAKWVISHFPGHDFYVEPFGGAASVLMSKPRAQGEIYNDLDGDVVNVFRVLRDPSQAQELERTGWDGLLDPALEEVAAVNAGMDAISAQVRAELEAMKARQ